MKYAKTVFWLLLVACARTEQIDDAERLELRFDADGNDAAAALIFSRVSPAYVNDASGSLKRVPENTPRTGPDGLLIEHEATNYLLHASDPSHEAWEKAGVTLESHDGLAPTGEAAYYLRETDQPGPHNHSLRQTVVTDDNSDLHTLSCYVRPAERRYMSLKLLIRDGTLAQGFFELRAATHEPLDATATGMQAAIDGWQRVWIVTPLGVGTTDLVLELNIRDDGNTLLYEGNTSSGFYVWGCQLERGSAPTSLIDTTGSAATRSADDARLVLPSATRATLVVDFALATPRGERTWLVATDTTALLAVDETTGALRYSGGSWTTNVIDATRIGRAAIAWTANAVTIVLDGGDIATIGDTLAVDTIRLGAPPDGETAGASVWIRSLTHIAGRPSNHALRELTQ